MTVRTAELGWAMLGTGAVSRSVASDLLNVSGARRVAIWSRSLENAKAFADEHSFDRASDSIPKLLAMSDVDLVYIATPYATHADFAIAALEAGKHVLIEKPIGVDAAEAGAIAQAARSNDRFAMEAMWMRFSPAYISLRADVESGVLGDVGFVRASFGLPFGEPDSDRWSDKLRSSTLLDQAIYAVTLARDILGEPLRVSSDATTRADGVDLTLHTTLEFDGGRFAQLAASMVTYLDPSASVSGTDGWASVAPPFWATDRYQSHTGDFGEAFGQPEDHVFPVEGFGYVPMLHAVQDAVTAGATQHPAHPLSDSIAVMDILDRIRSSWSPQAST